MLSELANEPALLQPLVFVFDTGCLPVLYFLHLAHAANPSERRGGEKLTTRLDSPARLPCFAQSRVASVDAIVCDVGTVESSAAATDFRLRDEPRGRTSSHIRRPSRRTRPFSL